jgi:hypothetical protein
MSWQIKFTNGVGRFGDGGEREKPRDGGMLG